MLTQGFVLCEYLCILFLLEKWYLSASWWKAPQENTSYSFPSGYQYNARAEACPNSCPAKVLSSTFFFHAVVTALIIAFTYPGQDTSLSSLIPLCNLPTFSENSLLPNLPRRQINGVHYLNLFSLPQQRRVSSASLACRKKQLRESSHRANTRLGCWGWEHEPRTAECWDAAWGI